MFIHSLGINDKLADLAKLDQDTY